MTRFGLTSVKKLFQQTPVRISHQSEECGDLWTSLQLRQTSPWSCSWLIPSCSHVGSQQPEMKVEWTKKTSKAQHSSVCMWAWRSFTAITQHATRYIQTRAAYRKAVISSLPSSFLKRVPGWKDVTPSIMKRLSVLIIRDIDSIRAVCLRNMGCGRKRREGLCVCDGKTIVPLGFRSLMCIWNGELRSSNDFIKTCPWVTNSSAEYLSERCPYP